MAVELLGKIAFAYDRLAEVAVAAGVDAASIPSPGRTQAAPRTTDEAAYRAESRAARPGTDHPATGASGDESFVDARKPYKARESVDAAPSPR